MPGCGPLWWEGLDLLTKPTHQHSAKREHHRPTDRGIPDPHSASVERLGSQGPGHSAACTLSMDSVTPTLGE